MTCEHVRPMIVGYHLAMLAPDERHEVEAHLLECFACVGELVAQKRAFELHGGPAPPPRAKARVRAAVLATVAARRRPKPRWERPFALAAAAVLLVVAARLTTLLTGGEGAAPRGAHAGGDHGDRVGRVGVAVAVARQRSHSLPSGSSIASNGSARTISSSEWVATTR